MNELQDITGLKFNHLTAIKFLRKNSSGNKIWLFKCDCEQQIEIERDCSPVKRGKLKSCGCARKGCNIKDLTNKKFGHLTVIKFVGIGKKSALWECICDCENKNIKIVSTKHLQMGGTRSCGCIQYLVREKSSRWIGLEEISGSFFQQIRKGARRRNIEFKLTIEYIWKLYLKQNKKCKYSGIELSFVEFADKNIKVTASLDRIDSSKGYIEGNVQWVHKVINMMKWQLSEKEFLNWIKVIYENSNI